MMEPSLAVDYLIQQLLSLGVKPGGVLLVHCAFSKVRPVNGGPLGLITALETALGPAGTLCMPSMTSDDDHPFDPKTTDCKGLGIVADTFWRQPGVLRSDSPHAFSAKGPLAERITALHPPDLPHGLESPVGRIYELDGQVLLLGVDHTSNTTIHLCENLAGVRYRRAKRSMIIQDGRVQTISYGEIDHCCQNFRLVDSWLEDEGLQSRGRVGNAEARLIRSKDIVRIVTERLSQDETIFLHPYGVDEECDEARASIGI
jgi:aminoglycoside 3-N-acetyltransferase